MGDDWRRLGGFSETEWTGGTLGELRPGRLTGRTKKLLGLSVLVQNTVVACSRRKSALGEMADDVHPEWMKEQTSKLETNEKGM